MQQFTAVYYEPQSLEYPLGKMLREKYKDLPWIPIDSHNRIEEMTKKKNSDFPEMKRFLIIGTRKTHKYSDNFKVSDYLVPFTSSGCTAMCLYCYLVCNYNKCAYLRLFVNREQMLERLIKFSYKSEEEKVFEVGSNSDLLLENTITGNLEWLIPEFAEKGRGKITFPTKFDMVEPLLTLDHRGKTIFRMSVNPEKIIRRIELGTSPLEKRIDALNQMCEAGYPCGILIAPVILTEDWEALYSGLLDTLQSRLSNLAKSRLFIEIIFMTYSYVHRAINSEAFPSAIDLYNPQLMTGRGRGRYTYRSEPRAAAELMLREQIKEKLPQAQIIYVC